MKRNIHNIELEIPNSGIFIKGLENENLIISLSIMKFKETNLEKIATLDGKLDVGGLAKPLHPYIIYEVLEKNNKNIFNDVNIIDKRENENNIIYYFNFGLILNTFIGENEDNKDKEALKTLSFMQNFIPACFFSYQIIGDSKAISKNVLEDLKNRYGYEGKNYKSIFKKEVYINCNCLERLNFSHCEFESKVSLRFLKDNKYKEFHNGVDFSNCIFKNEVDFSYFVSGAPLPDNKYYNNAQNTLFKDCIFENKVDFHNSKITNNIYFNNAHFKDYVDFHECEFNKIACFYGVRFDKAPNFSQAIFKDNFNALNITLNFYFDDLKIQISKEYENFNKDIKEKENKKPLDKFANDFRDSFRIFKSALIKDNNLLDTSNFHKYELYCKEIELKNKKGKTFKDVVDRWQLIFYRKLCDHHTDILQSLNSLILVIGIFVISSVATVVGFNYSLGYKPILEHWYFSLDFYNHHINSIIQDNYLFVATVNLVMLFGYLILVGFALCLKYMREFFIIISYVITLLVLAVSPKILIPAMGIFTDKRAILDPLSVLGGIYTIIFGFVAFSFIKTIRKNSIVPS
ncbi:pentapeptide repeat-containing protein [Campylobacter jejuni]|uniref:Pentapeptide repeat-containing protein n=1 Tax=Campylobacter jejuni TaxID=197 RepID=A0AAW5EG97_CAMJU|nr:pentapeptide repeat-containing protein [Campylobacter jejuni]EAK0487317.1 pentapeptide repeat-containing protein [Campylobacter jejuni]MCE3576334.1 pentapeptide repeat-containing protein [Campylobacter jejuni]MCE4861104.1 pentapeptide repeat-containing protein [Campylobacter jejuni]MCH3835199.1 pentapeptide repeat-containing protein [Campylobacter jejuni]MCH3838825.1 pentapeptide repeat-containing protein [Campylobacter jejuni]